MAWTAVSTAPNAVMTTTGTGSSRRAATLCMSSMPSMPGILRSVRTRLGSKASSLQRLERVCRGLDLVALVAEQLGQGGAGVGLVVDHEDPTAVGRLHDAPSDGMMLS